MDLAPADQAAEINAFVQKRFHQRSRSQPRGRPTQPGRFPPSRSASAPVRPPPHDRADVQSVSCNTKGHTAQECRQPRVDKSQRKCFLCDKPRHVARDCKERRAPIQAVQQQPPAGSKDPAFLGCVHIADTDGFLPVSRGIRTQVANVGDFIPSLTTARKSHSARANRFRELTVDDLNALSTPEIASRGGGHPLLMTAGDEPKLADAQSLHQFPPLRPSVQGEKCGVSTRPSAPNLQPALRPLSMALPSATQTVETDFVPSLHDLILRAIMSGHPVSSQDINVFSTFAQHNYVGVGGERVHDTYVSLARVGV